MNIDKKYTYVIDFLAALSALFHDFGKATLLFQHKINPKKKSKIYEPYRHEWVSLRLFQAFAANKSDQQWLSELTSLTQDDESTLIENLYCDNPSRTALAPFEGLSPVARVVAWLIVSHHRLPAFTLEGSTLEPSVKNMANWLDDDFDSIWNSKQSIQSTEHQRELNWSFKKRTPFSSNTWRLKASEVAKEALCCKALFENDYFDQRFISHIARLTLILADQHYSSLPPEIKWQDPNYTAYANTDRIKKIYNQKLDEHNIGVSHYSSILAHQLPSLKQSLPTISNYPVFKIRSTGTKFEWQDKAYDCAVKVSQQTSTHGFFGINMASTGRGKTFANARIMYGLSDEAVGARFSVALGLRTLTLQTGDALKERLKLKNEEIAVLIGSAAVQQMHESNKAQNKKDKDATNLITGSESLSEPLGEDLYVQYAGEVYEGPLKSWLKEKPKFEKLLSAPILISTIDHLIPATEGVRGGKQIVPILRLLTSDLVLDEPDDFDVADLPALCRLVNWAGMLGSRVLLSSATMPPVFVCALFEAYRTGREHYNTLCNHSENPLPVVCSWFDEFDSKSICCTNKAELMQGHSDFVLSRKESLEKETPLRKGDLLDVSTPSRDPAIIIASLSTHIRKGIYQLHDANHQVSPCGQKVSIGLVRMANIKPLVAVAQTLFSMPADEGYQFHYCVYHSQHPLAVRSAIEQRLDSNLTRYDVNALWDQVEIKAALAQYPSKHHVFVVLATSVAEVGRDHDYDWAIAEPSSVRSLIQLVGRIQRHRQKIPTTTNLLILSRNYRALRDLRDKKGNSLPAYCQPGPERDDLILLSHDLKTILPEHYYRQVNSIPRITQPKFILADIRKDFVTFEHFSLIQSLFPPINIPLPSTLAWPADYASQWWDMNVTWSAELQRRRPFRKSSSDAPYCLFLTDNEDEPIFMLIDDNAWPRKEVVADNISMVECPFATGNHSWFVLDTKTVYRNRSQLMQMTLEQVSREFGEIRLRVKKTVTQWYYHPMLGVFQSVA
ncbi:type I-F CRISPR-associated helicase Cas3f [Rheinheimera sp. UJ63]|uniref:type I-F CRISPR-associated helicase Cas3f n=1 Tax=Rheinheimera sp. UJ63 TaxID=2910157 RepID=UPI001F28BE65|nr:type I-F CRISPR-associated helicase Cas3f [Rheinheimera sp. UJ63]MCF4010650.1 type I-F CRISPR-associated helicase Cas3f [Rheinheimera sp. UJ63]